MEAWAKRRPHLLIVSVGFQGHFGPIIQTVHHLAEHCKGMTVTVWGTEERIEDLARVQKTGDLASLDLRLVKVLGPLPVYHLDTAKFPVRGVDLSETNRRECEALMRELVEQKDGNEGPTMIIADFLQYWSKDLADELGVPWWAYWSLIPACSLAILLSPDLIKDGLYISSPEALIKNNLLTTVHGLAYIRMGDLIPDVYNTQEFWAKVIDRTKRATGILLNSAEVLEEQGGALAALRALAPSAKVLPIGPSLQYPGYGAVYTSAQANARCLQWLDTRAASTVLYICFGTFVCVSEKNVRDLAAGLEASGVPFLWALNPRSSALSDLLPAGFEERTKERGFIETGFAPQSLILAHASIGGFLTHGGWNSTMESLVSSVPLIVWPVAIDQLMTARHVADALKVGLNIADSKPEKRDSFADIGQEEVEKSIQLLMRGEEGRQVRKNVLNLEKSLVKTVAKEGSSYQNLHYFLDRVAGVGQ